MTEFYYRLEEAICWEGSQLRIDLFQFRVIRRTAKGCFIDLAGWCCSAGYRQASGRTKPRFILDGARKRYAYPTVAEALTSFIARKEMQLAHLTRGQDFATAALETAKRADFKVDTNFTHERLARYHTY